MKISKSLKIALLLSVIVSHSAQADGIGEWFLRKVVPSWLGGASDCTSGYNSVRTENGATTGCAAGNKPFYAEVHDNGNVRTTMFGYGPGVGDTMANNARQAKINKIKDQLSANVYPIVDQNQNIYGTAFRFENRIITALHVVAKASNQQLGIFDKTQKKLVPITGYAPSKRDAVNDINYYEDFVALEINGRSSFGFAPVESIDADFKYYDLSYPRGKTSMESPNGIEGTTQNVRTAIDQVVVLNREGQDFNSSGAAIYDFLTGGLKAMDICIARSNVVVALNLSLLKESGAVEKAVSQGFLKTLSDRKYNFVYQFADKENPCDPIGGRRGDPVVDDEDPGADGGRRGDSVIEDMEGRNR